MTHAHVVQFFKDLGECPLQRIVETQASWRGTTGLRPMLWERHDSHPIFALVSEADYLRFEYTQSIDLRAHVWTVRCSEQVEADECGPWIPPGSECVEWTRHQTKDEGWHVTWKVEAETRDEVLDLAGAAYVAAAVRRAAVAEYERQAKARKIPYDWDFDAAALLERFR